MQSTEWRPVVSFEGLYEVSDRGEVRSVARSYIRHGYPVAVRGKLLRGSNFRGYRQVRLSRQGQGRAYFVHRLVAEAFIGPAQPGQEVCHGDGSRANNHASNLRWGTREENMQDSLLHGTHANAAKDSCKRGHPFTESNTREVFRKGRPMRVCIACRERKVACPLCGEDRSYYGMKSHLLWGHRVRIEGRSWQKELTSIYRNWTLSSPI